MNTLYVIVIMFINSATGEYMFEVQGAKPMTLEECTKTLVERGPVSAKDETAQFGVCKRYDEGKKT